MSSSSFKLSVSRKIAFLLFFIILIPLVYSTQISQKIKIDIQDTFSYKTLHEIITEQHHLHLHRDIIIENPLNLTVDYLLLELDNSDGLINYDPATLIIKENGLDITSKLKDKINKSHPLRIEIKNQSGEDNFIFYAKDGPVFFIIGPVEIKPYETKEVILDIDLTPIQYNKLREDTFILSPYLIYNPILLPIPVDNLSAEFMLYFGGPNTVHYISPSGNLVWKVVKDKDAKQCTIMTRYTDPQRVGLEEGNCSSDGFFLGVLTSFNDMWSLVSKKYFDIQYSFKLELKSDLFEVKEEPRAYLSNINFLNGSVIEESIFLSNGYLYFDITNKVLSLKKDEELKMNADFGAEIVPLVYKKEENAVYTSNPIDLSGALFLRPYVIYGPYYKNPLYQEKLRNKYLTEVIWLTFLIFVIMLISYILKFKIKWEILIQSIIPSIVIIVEFLKLNSEEFIYLLWYNKILIILLIIILFYSPLIILLWIKRNQNLKYNFMNFAIVASKQDIAGMNIASFIQGLPKYFTDKDIIYAESIDKEQNIKEDFIVFASRHKGTQEKILSLHAPGNWKMAEFGGMEGKVCKTSAKVLKIFFQELNKNIPKGWQATLECTHHGPYIEKPCLFIEIGSNKENWKDKEAAKAIATTIENAVKILQNNLKYKSAVAIGGPHYCPNFNKIQLNSEYAISHVIPEYALPLTEEMLKEAISKTLEPVEVALLDWKGLGKSEQRKQVVDMLEKMGLKYKRTGEVGR